VTARRVTYDPSAVAKIDAAVDWWKVHRPSSRIDLRAEIDAWVGSITRWPGVGQRVGNVAPALGEVRRVVLRTGHLLVYRVEPKRIYSVALHHAKRRPRFP